MKPDERKFLDELQKRTGELLAEYESTLEIAARLGLPYKRARYICFKWCDKGWYEYGVSWEVGWLTVEGRSV